MSNRLAILIGNGRFDREPSLPELHGPRHDVSSLGEVLSDPEAGSFVVFELLDRDSTQLQPELERIFAMGHEGATVIVYYAGYVLVDPGRGLFLATADTDLGDLKKSALPLLSIKSLLRSCGSGSIAVILDCCYVGPSGRVDPVDVEQQLRRIRTDVRPEIHVIAAPPSEAARGEREITTDNGKAGRLTHCIVEGLATGAADRDGDNRTGVRDLNEYLGMRLGEHRPLWSGPLDGADPEIVANPNPIEGVDVDAFRSPGGAPRGRRRLYVALGGVAAAILLVGAAAGYFLTRGAAAPAVARLSEPYDGSAMPDDVALVANLDRLRSVINLTGWVEHIELLDGAGPRYPGAVELRYDTGNGKAVGTLSLGLRQSVGLVFGAGVHGFGVHCSDGINVAEVRVELVDGSQYNFDVRADSDGRKFFGFVSRKPIRRARIRSTSLRFAAERVYVYAEQEFDRASESLR